MRFFFLALATVATIVAAGILANQAMAQLRTAPDITNRNYNSGTGVTREGIIPRSSPHRNSTNYVVPRGSYYHYGYSSGPYFSGYPGRQSYYDYYYDDYLCPYCGIRGCRGGCRYRRGPIYLPPVAANPGAIYGPRITNQLLGVGGGNQQNNNNNGGGPIQQAAARAPATPPQLSNPSSRALAWKFVEYGDRHFKNGDYGKAAVRYRKARDQADDLADIHFREAFAELGIEHYADSVAAIRKGLALKPDWPQSGFVLEELYPTPEAKRAVFRQLNVEVEQHPNDADALFVLGMLEYFDGREAASELRMRRVVELSGVNEHAVAFLPPPGKQPQQVQPPMPAEPAPQQQPPADDPLLAPAGQ